MLKQGLTSILVTSHFHSTCCVYVCALVKNAGGETDGERTTDPDRASVLLSTRRRPLLSVISYFISLIFLVLAKKKKRKNCISIFILLGFFCLFVSNDLATLIHNNTFSSEKDIFV